METPLANDQSKDRKRPNFEDLVGRLAEVYGPQGQGKFDLVEKGTPNKKNTIIALRQHYSVGAASKLIELVEQHPRPELLLIEDIDNLSNATPEILLARELSKFYGIWTINPVTSPLSEEVLRHTGIHPLKAAEAFYTKERISYVELYRKRMPLDQKFVMIQDVARKLLLDFSDLAKHLSTPTLRESENLEIFFQLAQGSNQLSRIKLQHMTFPPYTVSVIGNGHLSIFE